MYNIHNVYYILRGISSNYTPPHNSGGVLWYHVSCLCVRPSVYDRPYVCFLFSFLGNYLSKCQWIVTKLSVGIDIVEIWFGIINGQILSVFDSNLPATRPYSSTTDIF